MDVSGFVVFISSSPSIKRDLIERGTGDVKNDLKFERKFVIWANPSVPSGYKFTVTAWYYIKFGHPRDK
jgi:hypothetical protein